MKQISNHPSVDRISKILDDLFKIPGTNISIGLDGIIGLIPGVGDGLTFLFSSFIVYKAAIIGMPKAILARMTFNVLVDGILGAVPFIGDVFDFVWKANTKNLSLMRTVDPSRITPRTNKEVLRIVQAIALLLVITFLAGLFFLIRLIWHVIESM